MFKKVIVGFLILGTVTLFGMTLSQLNKASKTELMEISGIGEAKAEAILKERQKGKFKSFEDFQRVEGVGAQTAKNVKTGVKSKEKTTKKTKNTQLKKEKNASANK